MIPFEDFKKLDLRVGKIIGVEEISDSKNLLKLQVDFGIEQRQAIAGLKQHYKSEELINKKFVFILNLKPRKIMGQESNCMILAAISKKEGVSLIQPQKNVEEGSKVE